MNKKSNKAKPTNQENEITILLAEYQAIEQMHMHYDVLNMSITAIITAGVLALWGIIIQTAFQEKTVLDNVDFVNSVGILAIALFFILSIWIRYTTIHRCIVIQKLNRSHEIERVLNMKQNLIFEYSAKRLRAPIDSDIAKSRPGGHTLELFLYLALILLGHSIALIFQLHLRAYWNNINYGIIISLGAVIILAILFMSSCKFIVAISIKGKVELGFPWNILFIITAPITKFLRWLINLYPKSY